MKTHAKCKHCGHHLSPANLKRKPWDCTPNAKLGEIKVFINLFKCPSCGGFTRTATRIWPKGKGLKQKLKDAVAPEKVKVKAGRGHTD